MTHTETLSEAVEAKPRPAMSLQAADQLRTLLARDYDGTVTPEVYAELWLLTEPRMPR